MLEDAPQQMTRSAIGNQLWDPHYPSPYEIDPVVAAYLPGIDRSLLRENLKLTYEQRLIKFQKAAAMFLELRRAGKAARNKTSGD